MPEPLHPPYNVTQPRQLNRWLDVNSQNGPLTRTRGFISVPFNTIPVTKLSNQKIGIVNNSGFAQDFQLLNVAGALLQQITVLLNSTNFFTVGIVSGHKITQVSAPNTQFVLPSDGWTGMLNFDSGSAFAVISSGFPADKVIQFNFQATKNFSIKGDSNLKQLVDYCQGKVTLYIANVVKNGNSFNVVNRYKLTTAYNGENVVASQYSGQAMKGKYFQIEVWTLNTLVADLTPSPAAFTLNTTILGDIDYRFGLDFSIHSAAGQVITNFQNTNPNAANIYNLPLTFNKNTINGIN